MFMKKIFLIVILVITTVSCELFSPKEWQRIIKEEPKEVCDAMKMKVDTFTVKTNMEIDISLKF